jgi:mono/diheme cytochrome c family protein
MRMLKGFDFRRPSIGATNRGKTSRGLPNRGSATVSSEFGRSRSSTLASLLLGPLLFALALSSSVLADAGADVYSARCSACHGANGAGDTMLGRNLKIRPLGSSAVQSQSDDELAAIVANGKNKMPRYSNKLSKDQIREVIKYIRTLK